AEAMLAQFIETVHEEMDYRIEAQNLLTIKRNLENDTSVLVPEVFLDRTTKHVLTMEYLPGIKVTDVQRLDDKNIDREKLVVKVHRLFFRMLLRHNIFHADPHPGNISVTDDGRLILYDFGMVGRLDSDTRTRLVRLYLGLIDKDPERTVNVLIELGTLEPTVNRYVVERGIALSIQTMYGKEVDKMEVKALMDLANKTMSRFPFRLPKNLALYMRMASILEGIYLHHRVKFQFVRVLGNLLEEEGMVKDAYIEEVKVSAKRFAKGIQDSVSVAPLLKSYLETIGPFGREERNNGTLAAAVLASALFIGSALMLPYNAYLAYGGFAAAAVAVAAALLRKLR
ncbi:MAG: ABC1 kinase family protein, partial [Nitrososphaera sp.]